MKIIITGNGSGNEYLDLQNYIKENSKSLKWHAAAIAKDLDEFTKYACPCMTEKETLTLLEVVKFLQGFSKKKRLAIDPDFTKSQFNVIDFKRVQ